MSAFNQLAVRDFSTPPTNAPAPAVLPIFALGMAIMGFLGFRRKRSA
jgi:hypothetical protein